MAKKAKKNKKASKQEIIDNTTVKKSDKEEMDDFDKLLQEFIDKELSNLEEQPDSESSNTDDEEYVAPHNFDKASDSPLLKTTLFEYLVDLLWAANWKIDIRAIDKNILHVFKKDERYVFYLFMGDEQNSWLADEEKFNGELPLWFSQSSHLASPVFLAKEYFETINKEHVDYNQPIVVMMHPNHIINAEDMDEGWEDVVLISFDRLCRILKENNELYGLTTDRDDVGKYPGNNKRYKSPNSWKLEDYTKDIDNQLFWEDSNIPTNSEPNIEQPNEPLYEDGVNNDAESFVEIEIKDIKYFIERNYDQEEKPTLSKYFDTVKDGKLFVWCDILGKPNPHSRYTYEFRDIREKIVAQRIDVAFTSGINKEYINLGSISEGDYWLCIRHNHKEIYRELLKFIDIENNYKKHLSLEGFALYRINSEDEEYDHTSMMKRGAMSCYNYKNLEGVLATTLFKNISNKPLVYQFIIEVENEQGKTIYETQEKGKLDIGELFAFVEEIRCVVCPTGKYTVIVRYLDQVVFMKDFTVGHNDVVSKFSVHKLTSISNMKKNEREKVEDPMKELDSLVGLSNLKKQLRRYISKIQMDQQRIDKGLPVKPQQLHMAFLGNPGTGKTTVAKLLGQIYKEIGVLSNGNLELRDRSSLTTQNWGGEGDMVTEALNNAAGGILFIDEAYDLVTEHKSDPGKLVISALLTAMADEKNRDYMVIFAGYTMPMERLLSKNPGLRSRLTPVYFDDFKVPELMQVADIWLGKNCYKFTADARIHFESILTTAYASRDENFGNARYVINLLENEVQPAMSERVMSNNNPSNSFSALTTIEACDIPNYNSEKEEAEEAIARLNTMVGLGSLKRQIRSHLSYIRFIQARRTNKIDTPIAPLHMIFTGNPGTGKTSVAEYIGDIYRSMGLLSVGNVIKVTRADMIDNVIGGTEEKMKNILTAAHGNILFIDEAYTLFSKNNNNDFGKNAVEVLLDALGKENSDMIVILAGYPKEMDDLLGMNPGLKGRFPYSFNFEDYNKEELFEIAQGVIKRNSLKLTKGAEEALHAIIRKECKIKDSNFSNARFVVRLITTQVLPNMAMRLEGETDPEKLKRIYQRDIPIEHKEIEMINNNLFDEDAIELALGRLDAMIGLTKVKVAIHQFVDFVRNLNRKDPSQIERYPLKWSFVGNTGTGKSSVAEILSEVLKAMHLLGKGHTVEVKAEELYGVATYKADELLKQRMRESLQGLLFVDGDAPQFRAANSNYNPDHLRMTLAANTAEIHGRFAVVIAEQDSPSIELAKELNKIGISNFNHTLIFDDYSAEELMDILATQLSKHKLHLSSDAATIMYRYITHLCTEGKGINANARTMKELARSIRNLASAQRCDDDTISGEVVGCFSGIHAHQRSKIGY